VLTRLRPSGDLFLKMDIEGDEWNVLDALDRNAIARFRQIICEFHDLDRLVEPRWHSLAARAVEKLCRTHCALHVHGNNNRPQAFVGATLVPTAIEITFVRRDAYEIGASTERFPMALDSANDAASRRLWGLQPLSPRGMV
jgi:hypothetical protein